MNRKELGSTIAPILKAHGVTRAGLFGSAARGEAHDNSDIDIAVEINREMSLLEFIGLQQLLEDRLGKKIDLVEYKAIKPALKDKIARESVDLL